MTLAVGKRLVRFGEFGAAGRFLPVYRRATDGLAAWGGFWRHSDPMRVDTGRLRVVTPDVTEPEPLEGLEGTPSPGRYLRQQRQRRGMSREQLAAATNIPRQSIALLEEDRYDELPGQVFVKGFLRCCARALGIEQEKVIELLYERDRAQLAARRRESRPATGSHPPANTPRSASGPVEDHALPGRGPMTVDLLERITTGLSATNLLLWAVVCLFVAIVVMAAFNLVGGAVPTSPGTG